MSVAWRDVTVLAAAVLAATVTLAAGQPAPQPFPQPGTRGTPPNDGRPATVGVPLAPPAPAPSPAQAPDEALLGVPIYPNAQFIASYDAGLGQRYFLFGSLAPYADMVAYYRNVLKNRGDVVFEAPPVHAFSIGRFREGIMAFPPSVTVKDYTWGGALGYLVALPDGTAQRYPTIIQVVPAPPADRR
jgi:hypothetical protein